MQGDHPGMLGWSIILVKTFTRFRRTYSFNSERLPTKLHRGYERRRILEWLRCAFLAGRVGTNANSEADRANRAFSSNSLPAVASKGHHHSCAAITGMTIPSATGSGHAAGHRQQHRRAAAISSSLA